MVLSAAQRLRILQALPPRIGVPVNHLWIEIRRWLRFQRADVCLVSHPKAGRTWLRALVGRSLQLHFRLDATDALELERFADLDRLIPRILVTHDGVRPDIRVEELRPTRHQYATKRTILLVRDPRDILVSGYFHATRREKRGTTLAEFMRDPRGGYETILRFHRIWHGSLHVPRSLLIVRYEDLVRDTESELRRVMTFLGFREVTEGTLRDAVRYGSFQNMQEMEAADALGSQRLRAADPHDPESFKVRRGKVGGYRDYVDAADLPWLDEQLRSAKLDRFGYY